WLFLAGGLALMGLPPFGLFVSELALFRAGFTAGRHGLMGAVLVLLAVAGVGFGAPMNRLLYGPLSSEVRPGGERPRRLAPLGLCMAALVSLGLVVPSPVALLLAQIAEIVGP